MNTELFPISSLQKRYKLSSRQAVYDRINALGIEPVVRGKLSNEQLDKLDKLDKHLKWGGTLSNFDDFNSFDNFIDPQLLPPPRAYRFNKHLKSEGTLSDFADVEIAPLPSEQTAVATTQKLDPVQLELTFVELVREIAAAIKPVADPLQHYEALEKAIANDWLLSTTEVQNLIGTKPKGEYLQRGSFVFVRAGKMGAQAAWRVEKLQQPR